MCVCVCVCAFSFFKFWFIVKRTVFGSNEYISRPSIRCLWRMELKQKDARLMIPEASIFLDTRIIASINLESRRNKYIYLAIFRPRTILDDVSAIDCKSSRLMENTTFQIRWIQMISIDLHFVNSSTNLSILHRQCFLHSIGKLVPIYQKIRSFQLL